MTAPVAATLVVGVGNRSRGDDAVGPAVIDRLIACGAGVDPGLETLTVDGDLTKLVLAWSSDRDVVVVDALISGREPGTIVELDGMSNDQQKVAVTTSLSSSHGFGLAEAVALAERLQRLPRSLTILAVEAQQFEPMTEMSPAVATTVDSVVERILRLTSC